MRRAAIVLGCDQSLLCRKLSRLEVDIGVRLADRSYEGVLLNATGQRVLEIAKRALLEVDEAVACAKASSSNRRSSLILGTVAPPSSTRLGSILHKLRDQYPKSRITIFEGSHEQQLSWVISGQQDIAVLVGPTIAPGLLIEPLWTEKLVVILPKGHRLSGKAILDLDDIDCAELIFGNDIWSSALRLWLLQALGCEFTDCLWSTILAGRDTLLKMVEFGAGLTLATARSEQSNSYDVDVRPLADHANEIAFVAVTRPGKSSHSVLNFTMIAKAAGSCGSVLSQQPI